MQITKTKFAGLVFSVALLSFSVGVVAQVTDRMCLNRSAFTWERDAADRA